MIKLRKGGVI